MDLQYDDFASKLYTREELKINLRCFPYNIKVKDSKWYEA
jgi:hypothetical protein